MPVPIEWDLTGKTAIVTADRRGWTPYLVSALAEAGADIAVAGANGSDAAEAAEAAREHGRTALVIETDVTHSDEVEAAVERTARELGSVDILVNNAQLEFGKPFAEVSEDEWRTVMDFNVMSMFHWCQSAGRRMLSQGGGRIVNLSSGLAVRGLWNSVAACAAQGAIHQLTAALALEWAHDNVRVNGIGAGWFSTDRPTEEDQKELLVRYLPLRRKGHPDDLSGLLVYLASDACDFVTGQTVFIDGGALAHA